MSRTLAPATLTQWSSEPALSKRAVLILDVSYLAQTPILIPVILDSPECVHRATTADS